MNTYVLYYRKTYKGLCITWTQIYPEDKWDIVQKTTNLPLQFKYIADESAR